jgi:16S rRNA (uracil1498-N3)-methyltransferase
LARRRFFVDSIRGETAELRGDDARHLARVLRAEAGQQYEITDGGAAWLAEIVEARGERVVFRALEQLPSVELPVRMTICAALTKFDRFEWMIEKATELGAGRILPVEAARSEKGLFDASRKRSARWERVAKEAGQQCRRDSAPQILPAVRFDAALRTEGDLRVFLEETTAPPLMDILPPEKSASDRACVLIGPEGGWTDAERSAAAAAGWQPVSLGPLILRAETAAVAAMAVIAAAWAAEQVRRRTERR